MISRTLILAAALIMMGCANPNTTVRTIENKPQLAIANASPSSMLFIDGVPIGPAAAYDGTKNTLQIDRGTYRVEVQDQGRMVFNQTIYLGDNLTKTITLPN
jgi:PBP1b-binding outer membrane lipoprotein LpoB